MFPVSWTEIYQDWVLMSLPWTILEYTLNQTWDYVIYHLIFSHKKLVLMSLPWAILEYALNQTWDYVIYHLIFSHKNLMYYYLQNYICQILRQKSISFRKMWNKKRTLNWSFRYPTNLIPPLTEAETYFCPLFAITEVIY